ncbi:unnamed protein product [Acanthoscelides obtectus]|uniref:Peptidase S1 domain-containing protein n=1 Tax=Acanthoscelides obtectus TaxID=200917 RepID=A0A9P0LBU3_ACAOB|nr:unnamed protein product [Acanthoscelides obtectus]CAK1679469.1 Plasminogen [Acanthoscelides obtectus]
MYLLSVLIVVGVILKAECKVVQPRIVNGQVADVRQYPYMAILRHRGQFACGGALISPRTAITAAHCLYNPRTFKLYQGLQVFLEATGETIPASRLIPYPLYRHQRGLTKYDIGVIQLQRPSKLKRLPVLNREKRLEAPKTPAVLIGYGKTEVGSLSRRLRVTRTQVLRPGSVSFTFEVYNGKSGSCNGDSGSPAIEFSGQTPIVVGVTSGVPTVKGRTCDVIHDAQSYTSVSDFHSWITKWII